MVIDTSALVAIMQDEPERHRFNDAIDAAEDAVMSAASFLETSIVLEARYGPDGTRALDLFLTKAGIALMPVTADQAHVARDAFRRFGKGRHAASLNFGDCFAYALAKASGETLLFKGNDFAQTDIRSAVT